MTLREIARWAETAQRERDRVRRRGRTGNGHLLWSERDDLKLRRWAKLHLKELAKKFPNRTFQAVKQRRIGLRLHQRTMRWWTPEEDARLRANEKRLSNKELSLLFPGRNRHSVVGRLRTLRLRFGVNHRKPKPVGLPILDQVRLRAYEDKISLRQLDKELHTHGYFLRPEGRQNWKYLARAVDFFGGELKIDWKDY